MSEFITKTYSLDKHTLKIDGVQIGGFSEGDGSVEITWDDAGKNTVTRVVAGKNSGVHNIKEQRNAVVSIKLNVSSGGNEKLYELSTNSGKTNGFSGELTSSNSRTIIAWGDGDGFMEGLPVESVGEEAYDLEYMINVINAQAKST